MSNSLDAILSQYESNTDNSSKKPKISNEDRLKKYFTEKLLNRIDEVADKEFSYGKGDDAESSTEEPATEEVEG